MKKILGMLSFCVLAVCAAQADIALDLPASGNYTNATVVLTSQEYNGATFDVSYTIGSTSSGANTFASSDGTIVGVGSDADADTHYTTLEGDTAEGLSFTGLSIVNFVANDSGLTIDDITGLRFAGFTVGATENAQDGVNVSFTDFTTDVANIDLSGVASGSTIDLAALANYNSPETALYIITDNASSRNRWSVSGLDVTYTVIPEPATIGMLGLGAVSLLALRRRMK